LHGATGATVTGTRKFKPGLTVSGEDSRKLNFKGIW
jgi:hypothetical protein